MIDLEKIKKYIPILMLVTAFVDTNFDLLLNIGVPQQYINWIKLLGLVLLAISNPIKFKKEQ